ncbi:MAG: ribonuclease D [Polyangiaceae bacterium]|nr:ribonuclease D [Polyangiaceae bacterium]
MAPLLVQCETELAHVAARLEKAACVALDLESNGLFAYRAKACIVQIATPDAVVIVDALATSLAPLAPLLESKHLVKIVHDVAFDARILAEAHVALANVHDTSIAARMLGRVSTGLASLLSTELGVGINKSMQQHDWGRRPLSEAAIGYLAGDVVHLQALEAKLFGEVRERNIAEEVDEETRYRLAHAIGAAGAGDSRPPYLRLKGIEHAAPSDLPILRRLAELREARARELDVPPFKVLGPDMLFEIARTKPKTMDDLQSIRGTRGITKGRRPQSFAQEILQAVQCGMNEGINNGALSNGDRAMLLRSRPASAALGAARRSRKLRLLQWRKGAAKERKVDDQVVLPGHCLDDLASLSSPSLEAIANVAGIGHFRVERDGNTLLSVLLAEDRAK